MLLIEDQCGSLPGRLKATQSNLEMSSKHLWTNLGKKEVDVSLNITTKHLKALLPNHYELSTIMMN